MEINLLTLIGGSAFLLVAFFVILFGYRQSKAQEEERMKRIRGLYTLVEQWYYIIHQGSFSEVDEEKVLAKEAEIDQYIRQNGFRYDDIRFSPQFRQTYLQALGVEEHLLSDRSLFVKLARCQTNKANLRKVWLNMKSSFHMAYNNYVNQQKDTGMEGVERQMMLLKLSVEA